MEYLCVATLSKCRNITFNRVKRGGEEGRGEGGEGGCKREKGREGWGYEGRGEWVARGGDRVKRREERRGKGRGGTHGNVHISLLDIPNESVEGSYASSDVLERTFLLLGMLLQQQEWMVWNPRS